MAKNKYNWRVIFRNEDGHATEYGNYGFSGKNKREAILDFRRKAGERYKHAKIIAVFRNVS